MGLRCQELEEKLEKSKSLRQLLKANNANLKAENEKFLAKR